MLHGSKNGMVRSVKRPCCCAQKSVVACKRGAQRDYAAMNDAAPTPTTAAGDFRADPAFEPTRALLRDARRIAVMSGAGMSAESDSPPLIG